MILQELFTILGVVECLVYGHDQGGFGRISPFYLIEHSLQDSLKTVPDPFILGAEDNLITLSVKGDAQQRLQNPEVGILGSADLL